MRLIQYLLQYRVRDMAELVRNDKKEPLDCRADLTGKTAVISGATSGIGRETALLLAEKGARLILLNRDAPRSAALEEELREKFAATVETLLTDFSSLEQVRKTAGELLKREEPLDIIIHNAGVFYTTKHTSPDGIEMVFQVNHLGSFMLNYLMRDRLKAEGRARILYVNSEGHRFALGGVHLKDLDWKYHIYTGLRSYGAAKTAQLLTMLKFNEFFAGSGVTINAMHPGNVVSNMGENNGPLYRKMKKALILSSAKSPEISARALCYLAASEELAGVSGRFFNLTTEEKPAPHGRDTGAVDAVWEKSRELCGLR
jgi:retinol dehydrogenase 13